MPQIRMKVGGMEYAINSDDDEAYVKAVGASLDARLDTLAKKNPFLSTTMVAVLAALEAYDESRKKDAEIERLQIEIKKLLEENAMSKMTAAMANRRLQEVLTEREPIEEEPPKITETVPEEDEDESEQALWDEPESDETEKFTIAEDESGQYGIF